MDTSSSEASVLTPNVGRMYDYYLGGTDNYQVDRDAADEVIRRCPEIAFVAIENRRALGRMVRYLAVEKGIRQFIDLGTGLPTQGHVHQVLTAVGRERRIPPEEWRVVYVDEDPVVRAHDATKFAPGSNTVLIGEDFRDPQRIIGHKETRSVINFGEQVAVIMAAVLHFVSDAEDPAGLIEAFTKDLPVGSCLVITHVTDEFPQVVATLKEVYARANHGVHPRSPARIEGMVTDNGLRVLDPGIVTVTDWDPPDGLRPPRSLMWIVGGIAQKVTER